MKNVYTSIVRKIDRKETGLVLYSLREKAKFTHEEICCYMGLESPRAIYKWENGQSMPDYEHLFALAVLYGVPVESIIRYAGESSDSPVAVFIKVPALRKRLFEQRFATAV